MELQQTRREYELIYVLRPQAGKTGSEKVSKRVSELITTGEGSLTHVESWGRRRLAFTVQKQRYGVYYYLKYHGTGALVSELERALRLSDDVMKFQTVKISDLGEPAGEVKAEALQFEHHEAVEEDPNESLAARLGLDDTRPNRESTRVPALEDDDEDGFGDRDLGEATESDSDSDAQ